MNDKESGAVLMNMAPFVLCHSNTSEKYDELKKYKKRNKAEQYKKDKKMCAIY